MVNPHHDFLAGQAALRAGRTAEAQACFERAVRSNPRDAQAWFLLGAACQMQRNFARATEAHAQALALKPDHLDACCNLAVVLQSLGRHDEAIAAYRIALRLRPDFAEVHGNLGNALHAHGDLLAAVAAYREALRLKNNLPEVHNSLGAALKALGERDAAAEAYRAALVLRPEFPAAWTNLALVLLEQNHAEEAVTACERALAVDPRQLTARLTLGRAHEALGHHDAATGAYRELLRLAPDHADAHCNLGIVQQAQGRLGEAIASYERALAIDPRHASALTNLGTAYQAQNRLDEAIACHRRAQEVRPDLAQARFNESVCQLLAGNFAAGWPGYEARWECGQKRFRRELGLPLWRGEDSPAGRTILVHPEQGLGDTLQFARYVPLLAARGAKVILEVQPPLRSLFENFPGAHMVLARGEALPPCDAYCPLLTLPLTLGPDAPIPAEVPYVHAASDRIEHWRDRLGDDSRRRIGLVWSGGPHHLTDHLRSIPLAQFRALVAGCAAQFISLQKELKSADATTLADTLEIVPLGAELSDFADTAALIANLDLVIAVDTSVAHLAGALGRPTWILLPFAPDWRWQLGRSDSPWYPTARLFRQPRPGDWDSVLADVRTALLRM